MYTCVSETEKISARIPVESASITNFGQKASPVRGQAEHYRDVQQRVIQFYRLSYEPTAPTNIQRGWLAHVVPFSCRSLRLLLLLLPNHSLFHIVGRRGCARAPSHTHAHHLLITILNPTPSHYLPILRLCRSSF